MNRFQGNPRLAALFMMAGGCILMAINHFSITNEHKYYMVSLFFGPALVLFGLVGLFVPGIVNTGGIQTGHTSALRNLVAVVIFLAGLAIGWGIAHFYYGIF